MLFILIWYSTHCDENKFSFSSKSTEVDRSWQKLTEVDNNWQQLTAIERRLEHVHHYSLELFILVIVKLFWSQRDSIQICSLLDVSLNCSVLFTSRLLSDIQKFKQDLLMRVFFILCLLVSLHFLNRVSVNDEIMNFIVRDFIVRNFMTMKSLAMKSLATESLTMKSLATESLTTKFLSVFSVKDKATVSAAVTLCISLCFCNHSSCICHCFWLMKRDMTI